MSGLIRGHEMIKRPVTVREKGYADSVDVYRGEALVCRCGVPLVAGKRGYADIYSPIARLAFLEHLAAVS